MRFFFGIIGIIAGTMLIWKTYPLVNTFGHVDWAERNLSGGLGGTYLLYKIVGVLVIVLSALYMFGLANFLLSPLSGLFGGLKKQ